MPEGIAFTYRKENQKKKYLDYDEKNIVPEMFCMENAHLLPARMEDFLWQQFWFDKDSPQKENYQTLHENTTHLFSWFNLASMLRLHEQQG